MDRKTPNRPSGTGCGIFMLIFSLPFAGVGVFMLYMFVSTLFNFLYMQTWEKTEAKLLKVENVSGRSSKSVTHGVKAEYEYLVDGRKFKGSKVSLYSGSDNLGSYQLDKFKFLNESLKKKKPVPCNVNPNNPASSILFVDLRWEMLAVYMIFIFAFGGFGFGILYLAVKTIATCRQGDFSVDESEQDKPWLLKPEWRERAIKASNKTQMTVLTILAFFWNLLSLPMWLILPYDILYKKNMAAFIGLIFPVAGLLLAFFALRSIARWKKFGESVFRLKSLPGVIGGKLEGTIDTSVNIIPEDGFELSLACVNRITTGSGKSRSVREEILWEDKKKIKRELLYKDYTRSSIPVLFGIPWNGVRETSLDERSDNMTLWRLEAKADVPGIDYKVSFNVPVFKTDESSPDFKPDELVSDESAQKADLRENISLAGIRMEKISKNGREFIFPAFRNIGLSIATTFMLIIWTSFVVVLIFFIKDAPLLFPIVFGAFNLLILGGTLNLWFYRSRILIDSRSLFLSSGAFFVGKREFDLAAIENVSIKSGMQMGRKVFYNLILSLKSGKKIKIAARVPSRKTAEQLAEEMNKAIHA